MASINRISLAIITRDSEKNLKDCLLSIHNQTDSPDEILIIDSSATEKSRRLCARFKARFFLPIRYFYEPSHGYAPARNRAVKLAQFNWIAFIDDDCVADPNWIKALRSQMRLHPKVAAIIGESRSYFPQNIYALTQQFYEIFWKKNAIKANWVNDLEILDTKNIVYRASVLKPLTFTNELRGGRYWPTDDIDMGMQLQKTHAKARYAPHAIVRHKDRREFLLYLKKIFLDAVAYQFYLKKWEGHRPTKNRFALVSKTYCYNHLFDLYGASWHKRALVYLLTGFTDQLLRLAPFAASLYE
jgi:glycosyltransferase involved in cell wall biosynthesis